MVVRSWKSTVRDWLRFNAVGIMGTALQLAILSSLVKLAGVHYLIATGISVEASILHNFVWHTNWTWADRMTEGVLGKMAALLRFNLTTGAISLFGNLVLMRLFVGFAGWPVLIANVTAILSCSLLSFIVSDRFVFVQTVESVKVKI
ncbi:MAG TPA: GtrA family protein [Blastocatellia bacterium]|nr:GtrA family protein [Blastocatellia bacterium]